MMNCVENPGRVSCRPAFCRPMAASWSLARGQPVVARVRHWPLGLPQYRLGHVARAATLRDTGRRMAGCFVTGNYFSGPSLAECLSLARETAVEVDGFLR